MSALKMIDPRAIRLGGWIKKQLEIQNAGLCGNLYKVWQDVADSNWTGGARDSWERVPCWLDGFIPMAYLLGDGEKIGVATRYIDAILAQQKPDGWICPCNGDRKNYDIWPLFLICKVLAEYYRFSNDSRIPDAVSRAMKNLYDSILDGTVDLSRSTCGWGRSRWFEAFIPLAFVKNTLGGEWIKPLAEMLASGGIDYTAFTDKWETPLNRWTYETHVVNLAMMLKSEAVGCELTGDEYTDSADRLFQILMKYNGQPQGVFSGDECLSGTSPIQGTELCSVVELMYSFEKLLEFTGDAKWADRLERVAFNALPAAFTDDMWAHQYDQMANQIECRAFPNKPVFRTNSGESHLFGLEPNYGCCTANHGHGWAKLPQYALFYDDDGIVSEIPLPMSAELNINDTAVRLECLSSYPFGYSVSYRLSAEAPVRFSLKIRVPSWSTGISTDCPYGNKDGYIIIDRTWGSRETVAVTFKAEPKLVKQPCGMFSAEYGCLLFSLPIEAEYRKLEYERGGVERKAPYCDYELYPLSEWRYAFTPGMICAEERPFTGSPFNSKNPGAAMTITVKRIPWDYEDGFDDVCEAIPKCAKATGNVECVDFIPYGCAKLRVTALPKVK